MTHENREAPTSTTQPQADEALAKARAAEARLAELDQAAHELAGCRTRPSAGGPLDYKRPDVRRTMSNFLGR